MKFVVAMMLAGMVLAFAGAEMAFAQDPAIPPTARDYNATTDKDLDGGILILNMTGLEIIADSDGDMNNAEVVIVTSNTGDVTPTAVDVGAAPWFELSVFFNPEHRGQTAIIEYLITDEQDETGRGTITVNVHPLSGLVNQPPTFTLPDTQQLNVGQGVDVDLSGHIFDEDPDVKLEVMFELDPATNRGGTFQHVGDYVLQFAAPNRLDASDVEPGESSATQLIFFTVFDDAADSRFTNPRGAVSFRIIDPSLSAPEPSPNMPPVANDDTTTRTVQTGQAISIDVSSLISDPDTGDTLTVSAPASVPGGSTSVTGNVITYTAGNAAGTYNFDYTVTDDGGLSDTGRITVTVTAPAPEPDPEPENRAPVVNIPSTPTALEAGNTVTIDVSAYISDPDGDPLTVTITTNPAQGTANIDGTVITYNAPDGTAAGTYSIGITVSDGTLSTPGTVPIVIVEGNTVPIRACTR